MVVCVRASPRHERAAWRWGAGRRICHPFESSRSKSARFRQRPRARAGREPPMQRREGNPVRHRRGAKRHVAAGSGNRGSRRWRVRGWRPLRRDLVNRPNDRLAGEGKITAVDADEAHRQQILQLEALGADRCQRIVFLGFAAFGDRFAHLAGMLTVEGFHDAVPEAVCLGILDEHFRPCDGLEDAPMPATQME